VRAAKRWKWLGAEEVGRSVLRVKMRGLRARIMRTQWLFVFSLHLFTYLAQMVVDQFVPGEDFWAKTSTFFHLPAEIGKRKCDFSVKVAFP